MPFVRFCQITRPAEAETHRNTGLAGDGIDVAVNGLARKQNDLDQLAQEIRALGRKSIVVTADVSNDTEVQDMVKKTVDTLGRLDIVRCY